MRRASKNQLGSERWKIVHETSFYIIATAQCTSFFFFSSRYFLLYVKLGSIQFLPMEEIGKNLARRASVFVELIDALEWRELFGYHHYSDELPGSRR